MPIDFTELVAGGTITAATLNTNFEKVNTYFTTTKVPNAQVQNPAHNLMMTWTDSFENISTDVQHVYAFKTPSGVTITPVEIQLYCRNVTGASVKANFYAAWDGSATLNPDTSDDRIFNVAPNVDADNEIQTQTALRSGYTSTSGSSTLYLALTLVDSTVDGTGDLDNVTVTLWAKADNRS